jgi:hypothetical protein
VLQYLLTRCWYLSIVIVKDKTRRCLINTWLHSLILTQKTVIL